MNDRGFNDPRIRSLTKMLAKVAPGYEKHAAYISVGLVELLLHFTAEYAPDGNLSRFSAASIADALDWEHEPTSIVRALQEAGYLTERMTFPGWETLLEWSDA